MPDTAEVDRYWTDSGLRAQQAAKVYRHLVIICIGVALSGKFVYKKIPILNVA